MPQVSIIIPCYNEQSTIRLLLEAIANQTFDLGNLEIIIADGLSTDDTRDEINAFQQDFPNLTVKVIDNLKRNIPSGLNRAIEYSKGEYIIRLDAHSIPTKTYVEKCVLALEAGLGENVGGIWEIQPGSDSWVSRSIALAASQPLGVGDAYYRVGGKPQSVDTVPFGAFRKSLFDQIGLFDETLLSNEDYEFNVRIRRVGGRIWMNPQIKSTYFSRSKLSELAKQYWRYGYWKFQMLVKYPETFRWRQLAGMFVLTWLVLGLLSVRFSLARWLLSLEAFVYVFALVILGGRLAIIHRDITLLLGIPMAIATMHFSWGSAFLWSAGEIFLKNLKELIRGLFARDE